MKTLLWIGAVALGSSTAPLILSKGQDTAPQAGVTDSDSYFVDPLQRKGRRHAAGADWNSYFQAGDSSLWVGEEHASSDGYPIDEGRHRTLEGKAHIENGEWVVNLDVDGLGNTQTLRISGFPAKGESALSSAELQSCLEHLLGRDAAAAPSGASGAEEAVSLRAVLDEVRALRKEVESLRKRIDRPRTARK